MKDDYFYEISDDDSPIEEEQQPSQREDDMPSFSLGISPPASQTTHPSEPHVSQLEILAEAVVDVGVTAALNMPTTASFLTKENLLRIHLGGFTLGQNPLMEDGLGKEVEYIQLNGQRTEIYVMKWLETIDPQKIKSGKRYKYRVWTQEEIDDFRYQYGPNLLLHEMNKIREQVI
ncbi:hypothetical protein AHAS_Ahas18G0237000 [Arachis hypogaea]